MASGMDNGTGSESGAGALRDASAAGMVGDHPEVSPFRILAAPSTEDQFNRIRLPLVSVACWAVDDVRFAFDSSFVNADCSGGAGPPEDIRVELAALKSLVEAKPGCPLALFGHADPVGDDSYNKALSERRSRALYALLIFGTEPETAVGYWQSIAKAEHWGKPQSDAMQAFVTANGGNSSAGLVRTYMGLLAAAGPAMSKTDFLAQGAGADRKGDFQGCSEFNPLVVFSQEKQAAFDSAKAKNDGPGMDERNAANAPNRRVLGFLFRKGTRVDPAKWPCPRAADGIAGCKARFWADGEARRSTHLPGADRSFDTTGDTFACRFYQRVSTGAPCHSVSGDDCYVYLKLFDDTFENVLAGVEYHLRGQTRGVDITATTNDEGIVLHSNLPDDHYVLESGESSEVVEVFYRLDQQLHDGQPWHLRLRGLSTPGNDGGV